MEPENLAPNSQRPSKEAYREPLNPAYILTFLTFQIHLNTIFLPMSWSLK